MRKTKRRKKQQQEEDQHILTQLATHDALQEKEAERTRKEEADDKRRQDELIEFEAKQNEKADKEEEESRKAGEEEEARKANTVGASGAHTRSSYIGPELNQINIQLYMIRYNRENNRNFSASDLKDRKDIRART